MLYQMPWAGNWLSVSDNQLKKWAAEGRSDKSDWFMTTYDRYKENRLAFFLAHGGGIDFINDQTHEIAILLAPNQTGKSYALLAWLCIRLIPVKDYWPSFDTKRLWGDATLNVRPWDGPIKAAMASYEWMHVKRNLWDKFVQIMPADQLREYSLEWAKKHQKRSRKHPNWNNNPSVELACGSQIEMFAYSQPPECFESMTYNAWAFDEQVPEDCFDGAYARGTTCDDFEVRLALTPHKVKGRPDTGMGGWIHKMVTGKSTKGLDFAVYNISMEDVPSAIVSDKKKKKYYNKYITEPLATGNLKKIRSGRSRWFGEFESSEGLVYDNWTPSLHWIDPFKIPYGWTRGRAVDPGRVDPTACIWWAMSPWGDLVLYREYYETGNGMSADVQNIIRLSGNKRTKVDNFENEDGYISDIYEELFVTEEYSMTVMDSRTFSQPARETGVTRGELYCSFGLDCTKASGIRNEHAVPIVKEWLEPVQDRPHILVRMGIVDEIKDQDGNPITCAPRLYVFNTMTHFKAEIEGYVNQENSDRPVDKDDHLMCALKYAILAEPQYLGTKTSERDYDESSTRSKYTGYQRTNAPCY